MGVRGKDGRALERTRPSWRNLQKYENALKKMVPSRISATPTINRHGTMVVAIVILGMADSAIKRHKVDGEWHFGEKPPIHTAMAPS